MNDRLNITTEMVSAMKPGDAKELHELLYRLEVFLIDEEGPGWRDAFLQIARVRQGIVKPQVVFDEPEVTEPEVTSMGEYWDTHIPER